MCVCARLMSSHLSGYPFPVSPALPSNEKKDAQLMRSNLRAERVLCRSNAPPPPSPGWLFSPCVLLQGSDRQRVGLIRGAGAVGSGV